MALIKCVECDREISDKAKICPNCGCPLQNETDEIIKVSKNFSKSKILTICIVALVLICSLLLIAKNGFVSNLDAKEEYALKCLEEVYDMLKNPESLQVHSIEWIDDESYDEIEKDYIYIDLSAQNSMGGLTRNYYIFHCGNRWDFNDDVEGKDIEKEVPVGMLLGLSYQQEGKGEKLDVDKILNNLK